MNDRTQNCGGNPDRQAGHRRMHHTGTAKTIRATDLFGDAREVLIEHDKAIYRLRITRQGKLILNK